MKEENNDTARAGILTIGDEILLGQITDTNASWLGEFLSAMGIEIITCVAVADDRDDISTTLESLASKVQLIVMTGGLGPTKDDITKDAICDFLGCGMYFDEHMFEGIQKYFEMLGRSMTEAHRAQCYLPEGVELLENKMGTAPGMMYRKNGVTLVSLPGVPYEMKWIMRHSFPAVWEKEKTSSAFIEHRLIRTIGVGETHIEEQISDIEAALPQHIKLAYLPSLGEVKLRLTARHSMSQARQLDALQQEIASRLGEMVYGFGELTIEEALMHKFQQAGKTLSTAESCTGGYIAHRITRVPGSSSYYTGSIIAYSYDIKEMSLGVKRATLEEYGAVSEETVLEMLSGLLERMETDVGIAVSGIAGPGGGTPTKPVGTVWLAYGTADNQETVKLQLGKDRIKNIQYTAVAAMNRLRLFLTQ